MVASTELFLAYVEYKASPHGPKLTFAEYVINPPDLKSLILVSMFYGVVRRTRRRYLR
jgi:hypothetical protein